MIHDSQIPNTTTKLNLSCAKGKTKYTEPLIKFDILQRHYKIFQNVNLNHGFKLRLRTNSSHYLSLFCGLCKTTSLLKFISNANMSPAFSGRVAVCVHAQLGKWESRNSQMGHLSFTQNLPCPHYVKATLLPPTHQVQLPLLCCGDSMFVDQALCQYLDREDLWAEESNSHVQRGIFFFFCNFYFRFRSLLPATQKLKTVSSDLGLLEIAFWRWDENCYFQSLKMFKNKGIMWQLVTNAIREAGDWDVYFYKLGRKK